MATSTPPSTAAQAHHSSPPPTPPQPQQQQQQQDPRPQPPTHHKPPPPFTSSPLTLLTQGAEALLYHTTFLSPCTPIALKVRPRKPWRHPTLDARLTRSRILAEARVLAKCRREGVCVPSVLGLDWEEGWLAMEWVGGWTVRAVLEWWVRGGRDAAGTGPADADADADADAELRGLMQRVGSALAGLHGVGVVHGDLTTSNIMLRPVAAPATSSDISTTTTTPTSLAGEIVLIDFGLAQVSVQEEDKAVDLYVLERAFASTHPWAEDAFRDVLKAYGEGGGKGARSVLRRLEDVRMRGRKKSMLG